MEINKIFDFIENDDIKTLSEVLNNGLDVNGADKDGYSLLHMAVDFDKESAVRLLLSHNDIRVNCSTNDHRLSALHFAAEDGKTHLIKVLLESGADINFVNHTNCTPLYFAVCANHLSTVQLLLERGADPNISDSTGVSPLLKAVNISKELTLALFEGNARMSPFCRELHTALLSNKVEMAHLILDRLSSPLTANRIGRSVLQNAVQHIACDDPKEAVDLIARLIEFGEDINISNQFGTPLHMLIQRNKFTNNCGEDLTSEAIFKFLVSFENCKLNELIATNGTGTPLTLALKLHKYLFAEILMKAGADINKLQINQFKYTRSADFVLKLLFYCGFKFKDSFFRENRPISAEEMQDFQNFANWLTIERNRVMSLKNLTRIVLRNYYKRNIHKFINLVNCPKNIQSFVLFE